MSTLESFIHDPLVEWSRNGMSDSAANTLRCKCLVHRSTCSSRGSAAARPVNPLLE